MSLEIESDPGNGASEVVTSLHYHEHGHQRLGDGDDHPLASSEDNSGGGENEGVDNDLFEGNMRTPFHPNYSYSHLPSKSSSYTHRHSQLSSSSTNSSSSSTDLTTRSSRSWSTDSHGQGLHEMTTPDKSSDHNSSNNGHSIGSTSAGNLPSVTSTTANQHNATASNVPNTTTSYSSLKSRQSHHRLSLSTINNNSLSITTPPGGGRKKRLSMNFALPVISSSTNVANPAITTTSSTMNSINNSSLSPTLQDRRRRRTASVSMSTTHATVGSPKLKNSVSTMGLGSGPNNNPNNTSISNAQMSPKNDSVVLAVATPASTMDIYLSQLAAKERKVVELKDEIKRVQTDLKRAELELKLFREGASQALAPPRNSLEEDLQRHSGHGLILSHHQPASTVSNNSITTLQPQLQLPPTRRNRKSALSPDPITMTSPDSFYFDNELPSSSTSSTINNHHSDHHKPPQRVSSTGSNGSYGACLDPDRSPPSKPPQDQIHPSSDLDWTSRPHFPPKDDVINMGKRVVEELGSQFWGLFEDIKNVTIGEESREYPIQNDNDNNLRQRNSDQLERSNSKRTNSYYIL